MSAPLVLDVIGVRVELPADGHRSAEDLYAAAARAAVARSSRLLFHAGAVERDGAAVLFPGESGTGKSTTVAACVRRGFGYLSDEMVALDAASGRVQGWPRPLMLTPWALAALGLPALGRSAVPDDGVPDEGVPDDGVPDDTAGGPPEAAKAAVLCADLGGVVVEHPVPVAHVVGLRRGASRTALSPMSAGDMLARLLASSFNHYRHGAAAWEATAALAGRAQGWWLDVADVDSAVTVLAELPYSPS